MENVCLSSRNILDCDDSSFLSSDKIEEISDRISDNISSEILEQLKKSISSFNK